MLHSRSIIKKLIGLLFLFSFHLLSASNFSYPFIENKGQFKKSIGAKVNLPGGALFIEKGIFTYNFYDQKKLADFHNLRTNDRNLKAHAFKLIFKNIICY